MNDVDKEGVWDREGSRNRRGRFLSVAFFGSSLLFLRMDLGGATYSTAGRDDLSTKKIIIDTLYNIRGSWNHELQLERPHEPSTALQTNGSLADGVLKQAGAIFYLRRH